MRYIISGSKGLIGEKLKKKLDERGDECIMEIDQRLGSNILSLDSIKITQETQHTDIFIHLAAHCKISEGTENPELPHLNNTDGIHQVLEFCRKNNIKKILAMSSSRVLSPEENPYTASKKYIENLIEAYKQCYGIEYIIIRPSTVYGECHDLTTRLVTKWIINALKDKDIELYGDENKTLDFTHVNDFVNGVEILLDNWENAKNKAYDICGNDCRKLIDVYDEIIKQTGSTSQLIMSEPEIAQPQQVKIDISDMKALGYNPQIKLEEGIERLINFYKKEGKKWIN